MPYGILKADTLTYYTATGDVSVAISGIAIAGSPLISGVSGIFTTSVSGATITGNAGQFTTITGGTAQFTNITSISGTFTSRISGATVTGTSGQFTTLTATTGVFTTSISGATISGDLGLFGTISGSQGFFSSSLSVPSGTASSPSISFNEDSNTGIYSPGADQVAISTSGAQRLVVDASGRVGVGASNPAAQLDVAGGDIYVRTSGRLLADTVQGYTGGATPLALSAANTVTVSTASSERLRITSAGLVGVGTSAPQASARLHVYATGDYTDESAPFTVGDSTAGGMRLFFGINNTSNYGYIGSVESNTAYRSLVLQPGGGNVGIGTTSPSTPLHLGGVSNKSVRVDSINGNAAFFGIYENEVTIAVNRDGATGTFTDQARSAADIILNGASGGSFISFRTNTGNNAMGVERGRWDSSGRLLVGTSSSSASYGGGINTLFQVAGGTGNTSAYPGISCSAYSTADSWATVSITKSNSNTVGTQTAVAANHRLGELTFEGSNGTSHKVGASIYAENDQASAWGATDCPSRLVFSTTADGASSPTERMRITSAGRIGFGQTSPATTVDINGAQSSNITAVAALDIDCSLSNYFTKTINANSTFTVSNVPSSRTFAFTLELTHTSGSITWFSGVEWPNGTAPTLTTGKTHLFMFITDDGGTRWRASSLINYTN